MFQQPTWTFIRPFVHCAFLLAMATRYRKHLQRTNAAAEASYDWARSLAL